MKDLSKVRQFAALLAVLFLAACGRGGAEDGAPHPASGVDAALPHPQVVSIGRLICGGHLSLAVVEKKFQQELRDFRLQTVQNHNWEDVVEDLKSGRMDGTFILSPLAMKLIRDGLAARIVLLADRNGNGFVLSSEVASIPALSERRSIIAVPHLYSQQHVLLHRLLRQEGVDEATVSVVAMPPRDMINSLRRGEIDGFVVGEP
ncbi:MAG: ABC transporter substrate-binding protein, partial [Gammaproteobacteria bacterium]